MVRSTEDALPLDVFRALTGVMSLAYFARTFLQANDFSAPDGLIDHTLLRNIFWYTRLGIFYPGITTGALKAAFALGCFGSLAVVAGWRVKLFATLLYALAVSAYRWNFLVTYVDDSVMHLALFWLLLLPVGRTLILTQYLTEGEVVWQKWVATKVPGTAVRCFLWNFALVYIVAGLWKLTSPLWLNGTALAVILRLPISFWPNLAQPAHLPLLILLNYLVIIVELLVPLMLVLPVGHWSKYAILLGMLGMHLGIFVTLDLPFASIAFPAAAVIVFRRELMRQLRSDGGPTQAPSRLPCQVGGLGAIALVFVATLTLAMASSITLPEWRAPYRRPESDLMYGQDNPTSDLSMSDRIEGLGSIQMIFFSTLWVIGSAQQYQLFNWIDQRNYQIRYSIREKEPDGSQRTQNPDIFFPRSTRHVLLHSYLYGTTWMQVPRESREVLRRSLTERLAARYCRLRRPRGEITIRVQIWKIDPHSVDPSEMCGVPFLRFVCAGDEPRMTLLPEHH